MFREPSRRFCCVADGSDGWVNVDPPCAGMDLVPRKFLQRGPEMRLTTWGATDFKICFSFRMKLNEFIKLLWVQGEKYVCF